MRILSLLPLVLAGCVVDAECRPGTHDEEGACYADDDDTGAAGAGDTAQDSGHTGDTDTGDTGDTDTGDTGSGRDWTVCASGGATYTDIQPAVDAATEGEIIYVCPGTYSFVEIERKGVSLVGAGPEDTIVDGGASHTGITISGVDVSISGFTLRGTGAESRPAALTMEASSGTIRNVWFSGGEGFYTATQHNANFVWEEVLFEGSAGGSLVANDGGSAEVFHSVFRGNPGGAISADMQTDLEFHNNLVVENGGGVSAGLGWVYNNVIYNNDTSYFAAVSVREDVVFENNIVDGNTGVGIGFDPSYTVNYNDVWGQGGDNFQYGGSATIGTNLEADPRFTDPKHGDFTLDTGFSPCVNAGNSLAGYNDEDGTRNDLGMFGGPDGVWTPL